MKCLNCNNDTTNPKFCSRSCSATYNNTGKRKATGKYLEDKCSKCGIHLNKTKHDDHRKLCPSCKLTRKDEYLCLTLNEYQTRLSVQDKHPSWVNANIRNFARSWYKHLTKLPCAKCGYMKHVELCHKKPLSSFPKTATIGEVNSVDNIIQLCPNCHWEFDNGLFDL